MKLPSEFTTTVPCDGCVFPVTDRVSPSTSVSFVSTFPDTGVSSSVWAVSSLATGASFTGFTVIVTVAAFEFSSPSVATYVKVSVPLKFASGVYVKLPSEFTTTEPFAGCV